MTTLRAPFNFVPLNEEVVFPEWASSISQDIPFSDGVSGSFTVNIEAKTPIFVRNGHKKEREENKESEEYKSFNNDGHGNFFIPATSIKGELRKIIEILSYSKMQLIDNKRYSIRDLKLDQYRNAFKYENVHCGWMKIEKGKVIITDNGIPLRISHKTLDSKFHTNLCKLFNEYASIKEDNKTAKFKYNLFSDNINNIYSFSEYRLYPNSSVVDKRIGVRFSDNGIIKGKIVFTGQPGNRKERNDKRKASGKFFEFVFREIDNPKIFEFSDDEELYKDFMFIYKDSIDWKYWKDRATMGYAIPVFFILENDKIQSIGLSYLYKLPFKKRMKDYLDKKHTSKKLDLSECIFGKTSEESIKGRVQITHAFSKTYVIPFQEPLKPYMGSPKPTYYPIYLEQEGENGYISRYYTTLLNNNAILRGWKIYPARNNFETDFPVDNNQEKNTSPFIPLGAKSQFSFTVHFHNLRPVELGAILYAINLNNNCYHSLGFAKPYGFGLCEYTITNSTGISINDVNPYIEGFKKYMEENIADYKKSPRIRELFLMLNPQNSVNVPLDYMDLPEFVKCKNHSPKKQVYGQYLPSYSKQIRATDNKNKKIIKQVDAIVTFFSGPLKQAQLTVGRDLGKKTLDMNNKKDKLKKGDHIIVEVSNNGKILKFIKKL